MADKKRNAGIIGAPNSGANEVFEALIKFSHPPYEDRVTDGAALCDNTDWGEYGDTEKPPYDAKDRKRLFGKSE